MIKSQISILVVNKLGVFFFLLTILFFKCAVLENKNDSLPIDDLPHNKIISLVFSDIIEKSHLGMNEAVMIGIPRISNILYALDSTLQATTFLSRNFMGTENTYFRSRMAIDSSIHRILNDNKILLRSKNEYLQNISNSKYKGRIGIGISPILVNENKEMAMFVWYSSGYDIHEAQYSIFYKNGKWSIEFNYYLENPQIWIGREEEVMEALELFKKDRLRNE